jgi:hypothetical protein
VHEGHRDYDPAMADAAVVIGVTAVLTSGVLGPLVLHHAQKDRDTLTDMRSTLDAAIEPLAKARAQGAWLESWAFKPGVDQAEVDERAEELLHQTHLVEAHGVKLEVRFPESKLVTAYMTAGGAMNAQAEAFWFRREGIWTVVRAQQVVHEAEQVYAAAYDEFIAEAAMWNDSRHFPMGLPRSGTG